MVGRYRPRTVDKEEFVDSLGGKVVEPCMRDLAPLLVGAGEPDADAMQGIRAPVAVMVHGGWEPPTSGRHVLSLEGASAREGGGAHDALERGGGRSCERDLRVGI